MAACIRPAQVQARQCHNNERRKWTSVPPLTKKLSKTDNLMAKKTKFYGVHYPHFKGILLAQQSIANTKGTPWYFVDNLPCFACFV